MIASPGVTQTRAALAVLSHALPAPPSAVRPHGVAQHLLGPATSPPPGGCPSNPGPVTHSAARSPGFAFLRLSEGPTQLRGFSQVQPTATLSLISPTLLHFSYIRFLSSVFSSSPSAVSSHYLIIFFFLVFYSSPLSIQFNCLYWHDKTLCFVCFA